MQCAKCKEKPIACSVEFMVKAPIVDPYSLQRVERVKPKFEYYCLDCGQEVATQEQATINLFNL